MIYNLSKKIYLSYRPELADSFFKRARGMIGRDFNSIGCDAIVFPRCNTIHTLFMTRKLDIIFVDDENKIVGLRKKLPPWIPFVRCGKGKTTIELPPGTIEATRTEMGDILNLRSEVVPELAKQLREKKIIQSVESMVSFKESKK
ncbi:MAG: hypothetical protein GY750_00690 [Lentisphaerae bacterium]|nr:hypothetical protein [Lentisphaerota bacterium]MCP4099937.1 hypothetical protein [Lentisphaerota bacterium]